MHGGRTTSLSVRLLAALAALVVLVPMGGVAVATPTIAPGAFMQIVAHEDDDILFMNPDIDDSIQSGAANVTVFMTAGQVTGDGDTDEQRARNRQRGMLDAYARMTGVPDVNPAAQEEWTGVAWTIAGRQVERYTLTNHPQIQLVFMNMRDNEIGWFNVVDDFVDYTIIPENGLVSESYTYERADVIAVLAGLMNHYQPNVLRAQDPIVDNRYDPGHGDHVAAGRLAGDAAEASGLPILLVNYRDYNIADAPMNLTTAISARKSAIIDHYIQYDHAFDPNVWPTRMYYRWARGTHWAGRNADGRPQIFVVRNGVVHTYGQTLLGAWDGPHALAGAGGALAPAISVGKQADGRLAIFARRMTDHHIVTMSQTAANGAWTGSWTDLGNPHTDWEIQEQIGLPVVASNANGRMQMFVKNGNGGVSSRVQTAANGGWGAWQNRGGTDVQDGLTAVTTPLGLIEVFASSRTRLLRWYQSTPNGSFIFSTTVPSMTPASPPSIALSQDGRLHVAYRRAGTAEMVVSYQLVAGGAWSTTPAVIGGHAGVGEPALVTTPAGPNARILMFERNAGTGVSMTKQLIANGSGYGVWADLSGTIVDYPAATLDSSGAAMMFAIGTDGVVHVRKQSAPGADSPFGDWEALP